MAGIYNTRGKRGVGSTYGKQKKEHVPEVDYTQIRLNYDSQTLEELPETVQGKPASDVEKRIAVVAGKLKWRFQFRQTFLAPPGQPGSAEIDFLFDWGIKIQPVRVDIHWSHKTPARKQVDQWNTARLNEYFQSQGWMPIYRIPPEHAPRLETLKATEEYLKEKFG